MIRPRARVNLNTELFTVGDRFGDNFLPFSAFGRHRPLPNHIQVDCHGNMDTYEQTHRLWLSLVYAFMDSPPLHEAIVGADRDPSPDPDPYPLPSFHGIRWTVSVRYYNPETNAFVAKPMQVGISSYKWMGGVTCSVINFSFYNEDADHQTLFTEEGILAIMTAVSQAIQEVGLDATGYFFGSTRYMPTHTERANFNALLNI